MEYVNLSRDLAVERDANTSDRNEFLLALQDVRRHEDTNSAIKTESLKYLPPIGLALNVIFLFTVARVRSMRTIVNIYLANLALADGAFLTATLMGLLDGGAAYWAAQQLLINTTIFASYLFVTALAFERFFAICRPLTFRAAASKSRAAKIAGVLWITAIIAGVGTYFPASQSQYVGSLVTSVLVVVFIIIGLLINASLYANIIKKLRQRSPVSPRTSTDHHQQLGRVVFMLTVNTTVFFSLNVINIVVIIFGLVTGRSAMSGLAIIKARGTFLDVFLTSEILTMINASINPLVYSGLNADYRAAVVEAFSFLCPRRRTSQGQGSTRTPVARIELRAIQEPIGPSH